MGGSLCARRSTVDSSESQPVYAKGRNKIDVNYKKKLDSKVIGEQTALLPTKSWSALLKDAPMNPNAKPFTPAGLQSLQATAFPEKQCFNLPPGLDPPGKLETDLLEVDKDDPEWMQYLSQKLNKGPKPAATAPATAQGIPRGKEYSGNRFERTNRPLAERMRSNTGRATTTMDAVTAPSADAAPPSNIVIHTEEYLKILKDGKPKTNGKNSANNGSTAARNNTKMAKGKFPLGGPLNSRRLPGESELINQGSMGEAAMSPMTASGLAKKWASALKGDAAAETGSQNGVAGQATQDDIWIEKVLVDQDLSDPAYWSETDVRRETECVERKGASAHLFGRRPRAAKKMIRSYVMQDLCFRLDRTIGMLLYRLQRFTDQHRSFKQEGNIHRRFVIGLKEVARRTKQARVDCLIVAPDIEEDADMGGLDDRMRELLASAYQNNIPVIFALTRSRLGRALGKSLQISVLGVLDATGARNLMADSIKLSHECRQAWLSRVPLQ